MSDISTAWSPARGHGDWIVIGNQLGSGNDLATAVLISLFTDRVANADDVIPDGTTDRRGWWADDPAFPIGSRLWLLSRAKQTAETLAHAQDYIAEALRWLIEDGVVATFSITVEWTRRSQLGAQVTAFRSDGTTIAINFASVWNATAPGLGLQPPTPDPATLVIGAADPDYAV